MEKTAKPLDKISVETIKSELMKTALSTKDTVISRLDPRILIVWYLIFAILPWFFFDRAALFALFAFVAAVAYLARVNRFVIFMLLLGIATEMICYGVVAYFLGGTWDAFLALIALTMKLVIISLSSVAIFHSMDPERLSDALLSMGMPGEISFAVSYGYRMVPTLIEQYNNIVNTFRLRSKPPEKNGFLYARKIAYYLRIIVFAFYPLIFNTAKRTRMTVEILEVRGFSHALRSKEIKKLKLAYLKIAFKDIAFLAGSLLYVLAVILLIR